MKLNNTSIEIANTLRRNQAIELMPFFRLIVKLLRSLLYTYIFCSPVALVRFRFRSRFILRVTILHSSMRFRLSSSLKSDSFSIDIDRLMNFSFESVRYAREQVQMNYSAIGLKRRRSRKGQVMNSREGNRTSGFQNKQATWRTMWRLCVPLLLRLLSTKLLQVYYSPQVKKYSECNLFESIKRETWKLQSDLMFTRVLTMFEAHGSPSIFPTCALSFFKSINTHSLAPFE